MRWTPLTLEMATRSPTEAAMLSLKQILELLSVTAAFGSGLLLYYGALGVPWEKQSYKGQTQFELETKRRQRLMV
jgi:hypothetical protein